MRRVGSNLKQSCQERLPIVRALRLVANQPLQVDWAPCRAVLTTTMCALFTVVIDIGEE